MEWCRRIGGNDASFLFRMESWKWAELEGEVWVYSEMLIRDVLIFWSYQEREGKVVETVLWEVSWLYLSDFWCLKPTLILF